jgi:hypothetical protein
VVDTVAAFNFKLPVKYAVEDISNAPSLTWKLGLPERAGNNDMKPYQFRAAR